MEVMYLSSSSSQQANGICFDIVIAMVSMLIEKNVLRVKA